MVMSWSVPATFLPMADDDESDDATLSGEETCNVTK